MDRCRGNRPPIRYVRESFFYGKGFAKKEDLNVQVAGWLEEVAYVRWNWITVERLSTLTSVSCCATTQASDHHALHRAARSQDTEPV